MNKIKYITNSKNFIKDIYFTSKNAHDILFDDCDDTHEHKYNKLDQNYREDRQEIIASIYLNNAIAAFYAFKSFYYSNFDDLEDYRIDHILDSFDKFKNEFLTSLATKHSYQHTDIYFNEFRNSVINLLGSLD